jgi:hypothetical protein
MMFGESRKSSMLIVVMANLRAGARLVPRGR